MYLIKQRGDLLSMRWKVEFKYISKSVREEQQKQQAFLLGFQAAFEPEGCFEPRQSHARLGCIVIRNVHC